MNNNWSKLDNVAKVFLANHSNRDTRCMRISFTLTTPVIPELLQQALHQTIQARPQFQVRIRRGFFWHYQEQTKVLPTVSEESGRPCPMLYGPYYHGTLHYQVTYYNNKINLDIFHALTDGTGAFLFLRLLVLNYLKLANPAEMSEAFSMDNSSSGSRDRDSFAQFSESKMAIIPDKILGKVPKAYHIQSRKLPYDQLQFLEINTDCKPLLDNAKALQVSPTSYLAALLMLSIHNDRALSQKKKPITISIPVNLRNYYPSTTLRNFFNSVNLTHYFTGDETIESLAKELNKQLTEALKPESIQAQMNRFENIESLVLARFAPLFIKQPVVRFFSKKEQKSVTAVFSNLGRVQLVPEMEPYIQSVSAYCSTETLFITSYSYQDTMKFGIATAYSDNSVIHNLIRYFQQSGCPIEVYASEVVH